MEQRVYTRVVRRAAEIVGGIEQLAKRLGVSQARVWNWLDGTESPSQDSFLRAVDIVLEHDLPKDPGGRKVEFRRDT